MKVKMLKNVLLGGKPVRRFEKGRIYEVDKKTFQALSGLCEPVRDEENKDKGAEPVAGVNK